MNLKNYIKSVRFQSVVYLLLVLLVSIDLFSYTHFAFYSESFGHAFSRINRYFRFIFLALIIAIYIYRRVSIKKWLLLAAFIGLCILSHVYNKSWMLFDLFILPLFFAEYLESRKICNVFFYTILLTFIFIVSCYYLGFLTSENYISSRYEITRYTIGFRYPNTLGYLAVILSFLLLLKNPSNKLFCYLFMIGATLFCWLVPNSMTATLIIFLMIIAFAFCNRFQQLELNEHKRNKIFIAISLFLIMLFLLQFLFCFTDITSEIFDKYLPTLNARYVLAKNSIDKYGIGLWGIPSSLVENQIDFLVDNAYFYLLIFYGIIPAAFFLACLVFSIKFAVSSCNFILTAILVLFTIYGFSETIVFRFLFSFVFIYSFTKRAEFNRKVNC